MELPEGFQVDPALSQQMGTTVAVNPTTGKRIRWSGKGAGNPNKVYAETMARERAKSEVKRIEDVGQGERDAYSMEATANRAEPLVERAPTGPFADLRIGMGRAMGGTPLSLLPGIPNSQETTDLEMVRNLGSQGALGDVSKLKGPLSEKELAFIQRLQIDPNATRGTNRQVIQAQKWVARRQAAYASAMRAWTNRLGSPSSQNGEGLTFDAWWGRYSAQKIPPPGVGGETAAPSPKADGGGETVTVGGKSYAVRAK